MLKICFILSSIGGPRMLSPLLSGNLREDVAYVVIQRMAGAGLLDVLVECLREEVNRKILVAGHTLQLQAGAIHFLPNERSYAFEGDKLIAAEVPGKARLCLDLLFSAAAALPNPCAVVVLSGMLTDEDGLAGLARLSAKGAVIMGTLESNTPVFDMIDQIRAKGLMGELYPPKYLLEHLDFRENGKASGRSGSGGIRFLVADDEEKIRATLGDMLRAHGIASEFAADGLDALRKIQKGKYDALILDLNMPEMDGLRTLEALKTIDPLLPIVVVTGMDDAARIQAVKEFNVLGVLQKPFPWEKLKKLLPQFGKGAAG
ncbi:MAG TPA: response regulator [Fibrobacteria bacterium]|nr:response regulator [Fibrobacteria bacterium]